MRTENLAIAFVDIAGFTERTSGQSREDNQRMLARFAGVVHPAVSGFDGRVVKSLGDAFLVAFRSSTNALHCAMVIHDRLAQAQADAPEADRFDIRVAVNAGDVRVDAGDVFGEAVNIASRIEAKTPPGEIYFGEAAYLAMTRAEVPSEEVGPADLRGIADPVRLYRVPRAAEVGGYRLAGATAAAGGGGVGASLPFGGHAFARMQERSAATEVLYRSRRVAGPALARVMAVLRAIRAHALGRWQRSRAFRVVAVCLVAAAVIGTIVAATWPEPEPKPLTPWQKLQRKLGID